MDKVYQSTPSRILQIADEMINKRASDRDLEQERSMEATVKAFNAMFGKDLTEHEGWCFMELLKMKRGSIGPYKEDDFIDGAAYCALAAEARLRNTPPPSYEKASRDS